MTERQRDVLRSLAPLTAYFAVFVGLFELRSAWVTFLVYHAGMLGILAAARQRHLFGRLWAGRSIPLLLTGIAVGLSGGLLLQILWSTLDLTTRLNEGLPLIGLKDRAWLLFVLYHFTINPWIEEAFWRGYLGSSKLRPIWTDALFAGYHILVLRFFLEGGWLLFSFVSLFFAAWFWRLLARRTGGLLVPTLSHLVADAALLVGIYARLDM